ncbi:pickpocket protein 11 [Toxorhynchites rutilus septentrionalis]|uniref:pickpocket protein 11 n=1 Tax=Toxorhynchites rutilus septentrionalis TaxID=329112 RepID=UPI00247A13F2|nr:pickpocket protein 11 [Toxorhynchites rutilus septentrionalis]
MGDTSLANIDMLDIAWNVRYIGFLPSSNFQPVITEMGMCFTSSNLSYLQNASNTINYNERTWPDSCFSFDLCKSSVIVSAYGIVKIYLYVHEEDDIMTATDTISSEMKGTELVEVTLWVDQIVASNNLRYLTPARRKCIYEHETSSIFKIHTANLCKVDCRVRRALIACGCIPFLYNIQNHKKCDASGMVCLSEKLNDWYYASCPCMSLCESTKFTQRSVKVMLNNQLSVEMFFPKRRIKRSVLFSLSDLIVSFGGAAALFLGCSFLSGVEFVYFFLEHVCGFFRQFLAKGNKRNPCKIPG